MGKIFTLATHSVRKYLENEQVPKSDQDIDNQKINSVLITCTI